MIYVSCEAETLARDLKSLTASGHKVRQIEAFDMFAQTDKLEWIAVLTK
jgi:23S rRNA (uracil1939-C5)-methyltransferase